MIHCCSLIRFLSIAVRLYGTHFSLCAMHSSLYSTDLFVIMLSPLYQVRILRIVYFLRYGNFSLCDFSIFRLSLWDFHYVLCTLHYADFHFRLKIFHDVFFFTLWSLRKAY